MSYLPKLTRKNSPIEGFGVFAAEDIPKGVAIIQYKGKKLSKEEGNKSKSKFVFEVDDHMDVLGTNLAKYINHSCKPNCESALDGQEIWISSTRKIKKGEEITYNYGYRWDEDPIPCLCGKKQCQGYMLHWEDWSELKAWKKKQPK